MSNFPLWVAATSGAASSSSSSSLSSSSSSSWAGSPNASDRALIRSQSATMLACGGQAIVYTPRGGVARSIDAIVDYPGPEEIARGAGGARPRVEILVRNNSTTGISSREVDRGGDKVALPVRYGRAAVTLRIVGIISQDEAMLTLDCV